MEKERCQCYNPFFHPEGCPNEVDIINPEFRLCLTCKSTC